MPQRVIILIADGFEETEALAPLDVMRRAGFDVQLISISESLNVCSSHNVKITADALLGDGIGEYDLLMLPGGMPGTKNLLADERVCNEVRRAAQKDKVVAAICAAPMILGRLGLLKGKKATCFPGFENELEGAKHINIPVVTDGKIITGRGAGAAVEFGLALITALDGSDKSFEIARQITLIQ